MAVSILQERAHNNVNILGCNIQVWSLCEEFLAKLNGLSLTDKAGQARSCSSQVESGSTPTAIQ